MYACWQAHAGLEPPVQGWLREGPESSAGSQLTWRPGKAAHASKGRGGVNFSKFTKTLDLWNETISCRYLHYVYTTGAMTESCHTPDGGPLWGPPTCMRDTARVSAGAIRIHSALQGCSGITRGRATRDVPASARAPAGGARSVQQRHRPAVWRGAQPCGSGASSAGAARLALLQHRVHGLGGRAMQQVRAGVRRQRRGGGRGGACLRGGVPEGRRAKGEGSDAWEGGACGRAKGSC
jgi:hypothetical protein